MIKILSSAQIRAIDQETIAKEPILSVDLMERAARALFYQIISVHPDKRFCLVAGPGNNGGDAVALYRLLRHAGFAARLIIVNDSRLFSADCMENIKRLDKSDLTYEKWCSMDDFSHIDEGDIIVEGIFGSGLSRPVEGFYGQIINYLNGLSNHRISIDIPSGLFDGDNAGNEGSIFMANETYSIHFPKLAFLFAENYKYVGEWSIVNIGLRSQSVEAANTNFFVTESSDISLMHRIRGKHSNKNDFGHVLVVAGSDEKYGAMMLCSKSCLRSGAGLVSVLTDHQGQLALNCSTPEAMVFQHNGLIDNVRAIKFSAAAVGPGMGTKEESVVLLQSVLQYCRFPLVIDADALNIISAHQELIGMIPENSIMTPHAGEFDRLFGKTQNSFQRIQKAIKFSTDNKIITVIKGANTAIVNVNGNVYFNTTGNRGMATAGSGDVLTGIIAGLLSSGYEPLKAAILGVWIHGKAGDLALFEQSHESLIASDIISNLGKAFKQILS